MPQQFLIRHNRLVLASYFSAFRRGLSLRQYIPKIYFLSSSAISSPSGGDFVTTLNANREVSRGLRSPVLETTLVSRTGLFSLKHEDTLDTSPTENSSGQLFGCEMTKPDARNLW